MTVLHSAEGVPYTTSRDVITYRRLENLHFATHTSVDAGPGDHYEAFTKLSLTHLTPP